MCFLYKQTTSSGNAVGYCFILPFTANDWAESFYIPRSFKIKQVEKKSHFLQMKKLSWLFELQGIKSLLYILLKSVSYKCKDCLQNHILQRLLKLFSWAKYRIKLLSPCDNWHVLEQLWDERKSLSFVPKSACSVCVYVGIIQTGCDKHMFFGFTLIHDLDNSIRMWSNKLQWSKSEDICLWTSHLRLDFGMS